MEKRLVIGALAAVGGLALAALLANRGARGPADGDAARAARRPPPAAAGQAAAARQDAPAPADAAPPPKDYGQDNLPAPPQARGPGFFLCAMTTGVGRHDVAGIVERPTGRGALVRVGERTTDGWLLVSLDFARETALFEKEGRRCTMSLEEGQAALRADSSSTADAAPGDEAPAPAPFPPKSVDPGAPFSNRVFTVEAIGEVELQGVEGAPQFVEVRAAGERYALSRDIVESVFKMGDLEPEQRLALLLSFPGVVQVRPGEDSAEQAAEAARQLAERLTPPAEAPSLEALQRVVGTIPVPAPPADQAGE